MQNLRKSVSSEQFILSGNKMGSHVESIGTCYLTLDGGFVLELQKTFYVSSFSQNLISISILQPSTSSDGLFFVHNTPQVQMGVEQTIVGIQPIIEYQPIIEVPQAVNNISIDQVD